MITDDKGNLIRYESHDDEIKKYSMIQAVYKESKNKDTADEIKQIFKKPERSGVLEVIGDYRVISSYSVEIQDVITQLSGKFWIKADTHTFESGQHSMKLEIEFENLMKEEKIEKEKISKSKGSHKKQKQ